MAAIAVSINVCVTIFLLVLFMMFNGFWAYDSIRRFKADEFVNRVFSWVA